MCVCFGRGETPALYTVLPEKAASVGGSMMGSSHVYDMASAVPGALKKVDVLSPPPYLIFPLSPTQASGSSHDGIEVALDPSELDLDTATMSARYAVSCSLLLYNVMYDLSLPFFQVRGAVKRAARFVAEGRPQ